MQLWLTLGFSLCIALITSMRAARMGRNRLIWFTVGWLFGLLGLIALYLIPTRQKERFQEEVEREPAPSLDGIWYYLDGEMERHGPMSGNRLMELRGDGVVTDATYVWSESCEDWIQLGELTSSPS